MDSSGKDQRQRQDRHSFLCPVLVPLSLIRPAMLFPLRKCVLSTFSAPPSVVACVSDPAIVTSAASLCHLQCLSVTYSVTPLLLLLVFSWPLLVSIPFHFITQPPSAPTFSCMMSTVMALKHCSSSRVWLMLFYVSLSLFSGMLTLPKAKLLHLFCRTYCHIPFFQLPHNLNFFDIEY